MKSYYQRHSSDITVKLLDSESLPTHASLPQQEYIALLLVTTDRGHTVVPVERNSILSVGRSLNSSIVLRHPTVSSEHIIIYSVMTAPNPSNSLVFCQDLKSENGTFIDSRRIPKGEALLLQHGDCLEIRHAAKIHLIQDNTTLSSVDKAIGVHDDLNALLQTFYIDRRVVGQGGHAKIFLAQHRKTAQLFACKIVRLQRESMDLEYSRREVNILADLSHANIIEMFSAIQTPTSCIIFEPLLCGGDLHNFIFEFHHNGLDEFNGKFIIFQILKAIEYLHSKGIVHRDLKMENILLRYPTLPAVIKIADFGCACHEPCPPERMTSFCGSLEFLAPEMIRTLPKISSMGRKGYGKEIDIWAVGIISFAILCGDLPFYETENVTENTMRSILWNGITFSNNWASKSVHAMLFVKGLLRKIPSSRPTASQALASHFLKQDKSNLQSLYHELVVSLWNRREDRNGVILESVGGEQESQEGDQSETHEKVEAGAVLGALSEKDVNVVEGKERKRPYPDGKENDSRNLEDEVEVRKRRKQFID